MIELKINNISSLKLPYNKEISTHFYIYLSNVINKYYAFFYKNNKYNYELALNIRDKYEYYKYLIPISSSYLVSKKNKMYSINYLIKTKKFEPIILNPGISIRYLYSYELLYLNKKLLDNNNLEILEISSPNEYSFLESCFNINKKFFNKKLNLYLKIFINYIYSKKLNLELLLKYKDNFKINLDIIDNYLNKNLIYENDKKYDIIYSRISDNENYNIGYEFFDYSNVQIYFLIFLFSLYNLKINGTLFLNIQQISIKPIADIILIGKHFFKNIDINNSKINSKFKNSGTTLIFKDFKGLDKKIFNELLKIADKLLKLDPTSKNFNILDNKLRNTYVVTKPITTKNIFYIEGFLNLPTSSSEYDFIREFNKEYYLEKILYVKKLIGYYHKYGDKVPESIKEQQLVNSYLYAKEFELKTIPLDKGTFKSELGTLILNDMYSLHEPIQFEFTQRGNNDNNVVGILDLENELGVLSREYQTITDAIDTRDIRNWDRGKHISRYYKSGNREIETLIQYIHKTFDIKVSQAWLKMYEICMVFPIINKRKKVFNSFHICELPGNFIRAINYYILSQTNIESFKWLAQSMKPDKHDKNIIGNDYDILKKFPEKWIFERDGDITNVDNIKAYKKYFKDVDLLTSDCGLGWKDEEDISLIKVHFAQLIFMFSNLTKGGNFVCKFVLPLKDNLHINMIFIMYKHFKKCFFYKPLQNMYSGEYYFIGLDYKPVDNTLLNKMFKLLEDFDKNSLSECICKTKYPKSFNHQIYHGVKKLTDNFMFNIERQFYYVDNAKYIPKAHIDTLKKYIAKKNEDWVDKFKLKKLSDKEKYDYRGYKSLL